MSVVFNEGALKRLLETEQGPVGREIRRRAEEVVVRARQNVGFIMARSAVAISQDVGFALGPDLTAIIGIRNTGRQTEYLAAKEVREAVWLTPALAEVFPD